MTIHQIITPLSDIEQRSLELNEIKIQRGLVDVGEALEMIRNNHLYRAYGTWENYVAERWDWTTKRADQLIAAKDKVKAIQAYNVISDDPLPEPTHESQVRPLAADVDVAVNQWREATAVYGDSPTQKEVRYTVDRTPHPEPEVDPDERVKRQVVAAGFAPVIVWMDTGKLTPKQALALVDALHDCRPKVRGDMLRLGIVDPVVIREMNRIREKESYAEICASGYLQFAEGEAIKAADMKRADLRDYLDEKYREHQQAAAENKRASRKVDPVNLTLYTNDADLCVKVLSRIFTQDYLMEIAQAIEAQYN